MIKHKHIVNIYTREIEKKAIIKWKNILFFCLLLGSLIITKKKIFSYKEALNDWLS